MRVFGRSDIGSVRKMNQDYMYFSKAPVGQLPNLFIVADGMGGHKAGDYASRMSVENFVDYIQQAPPDAPIRIVDDGIHYANELVMEKAQQYSELNGMGTTFVAAFIVDKTLYVANVGDSRLYLIDSEINQVTEDHSYVGAMVRAGEITAEEAKHHPDKKYYYPGPLVRPGIYGWIFLKWIWNPGTRSLCVLTAFPIWWDDEKLLDIISNTEIEAAVEALINEAKANGGLDNITAIVIDPFDEEVN